MELSLDKLKGALDEVYVIFDPTMNFLPTFLALVAVAPKSHPEMIQNEGCTRPFHQRTGVLLQL